jgi:hypothetical protein
VHSPASFPYGVSRPPSSLVPPSCLALLEHSHTSPSSRPLSSLVTHAYTLFNPALITPALVPYSNVRILSRFPSLFSRPLTYGRTVLPLYIHRVFLFLKFSVPSCLVRYRVSATLSFLSRILHLSFCHAPMTICAAASQAPFFFYLALRLVSELPAYPP